MISNARTNGRSVKHFALELEYDPWTCETKRSWVYKTEKVSTPLVGKASMPFDAATPRRSSTRLVPLHCHRRERKEDEVEGINRPVASFGPQS